MTQKGSGNAQSISFNQVQLPVGTNGFYLEWEYCFPLQNERTIRSTSLVEDGFGGWVVCYGQDLRVAQSVQFSVGMRVRYENQRERLGGVKWRRDCQERLRLTKQMAGWSYPETNYKPLYQSPFSDRINCKPL